MSRGVRWWIAAGADAERARAIAERALAAYRAGATPLRRARRKTAYRLALGDDAAEVLLKVSDDASLARWRRLGPSRARRGLACAERLASRGAAALVPIAVGERRRGGLRVESYELLPWIADGVDLARVLAEPRGRAAERRAWQRELGGLVRALHEAGVDQDDLAPNNFLWRPAARPALHAIDFERARLSRRVPETRRLEALAKLDRYAAGASAASRMRVLRAYCDGDRAATHRTWRAIETASAALWRSDLRRWTRIARRGGRRFARTDEGGLLRRDLDAGALRRALGGEPKGAWLVAECAATSAREAQRLFGVALALHQRGLAPRPDGFAARDGRVRIAYCASQIGDAVAAPARVVAVDRLLALGGVAAERLAGAFVARGGRALWIDPQAVRADAAPLGAGRRRAARRIAAGAQIDAER